MHFSKIIGSMLAPNLNIEQLQALYDDLLSRFDEELVPSIHCAKKASDYSTDIQVDNNSVIMKFHFELPDSDTVELLLQATSNNNGRWRLSAALVNLKFPNDFTVPCTSINSRSGIYTLNFVKDFLNTDECVRFIRGNSRKPVPQTSESVPPAIELYERLIHQPDFIKFLENRLQVVISNTGFKIVPKPTKD